MQCDDFQLRWQALLDERKSVQDDHLLAAHAAKCLDCKELLEIQSLLFDEIARVRRNNSLPTKSSPVKTGFARRQADLGKAVPGISASRYANAALQTEKAKRRQTSSSNGVSRRQVANALVLGLAVAGSLLVAIIPAWKYARANRSGETNRAVATNSSPLAMPGTIWGTRTPAGSMRNDDANPSRADVATAVPTPAEQEALRNLMQQMSDNFSHVPAKQLDNIAGGLRPLTDTLGAAFDALRRSIPVSPSQSGSQSLSEPQAILSWASPVSSV
jgi:hypothetical protein